ncbi:OmpA family protein [Croceibacterium soli]|nr:OmpA family protein [Croceibacterium soli]
MKLLADPRIAVMAGAAAIAALAAIAGQLNGPDMAERLEVRAAEAIAEVGGAPVKAHFYSSRGLPSRHPLLTGGEGLDEGLRDRVAKAVAAVPGVGGLRWSDGTALAESAAPPVDPLHCEEDVAALLNARTIRFEESSARIDAASQDLIGEVAAALRPCLGSIIAIIGHTDSSGPEPGNLRLSRQRAEAVRAALVRRGIPDDGLRARGVGASEPVPGLDPADPANRRIEFSVVATMPIRPTPVDTPGPR